MGRWGGEGLREEGEGGVGGLWCREVENARFLALTDGEKRAEL